MAEYERLLMHIWFEDLDHERKGEIEESQFFTFLRVNRVCNERKHIDEMLKQVLYLTKGAEIPKH
jgi:hypothetical protein